MERWSSPISDFRAIAAKTGHSKANVPSFLYKIQVGTWSVAYGKTPRPELDEVYVVRIYS